MATHAAFVHVLMIIKRKNLRLSKELGETSERIIPLKRKIY